MTRSGDRLTETVFYYLRHGETDWNRDGLVQGVTDVPLNDTGRAQAAAAARCFAGVEISSLCVSPLSRALETAEIVNKVLGLSVEVMDDLAEVAFGIEEGTPWENQNRAWEQGWTPEGGEPYSPFMARALAAVNRALERRGPVLIVGHQKGSDTKQKIYRNFGYARPDGYRKALRTMELAQKFRRPILCFVDTPAAYPGIESEERGVAEAIALNLREMSMLEVPVIVCVHGEGGSGGALGIAVGDRILMHEFAIYSVIPPEGCAAILWRDSNRKVDAADALKITAPDLLQLGVIDEIVAEPVGGAHTNPAQAAALLDVALHRALLEVSALDVQARLDQRYDKFRAMGLVGIVEA